MKMKRKRKSGCPSPLLEESPKRTKVHAQRKFAQGSNVNSPVITPIRELESESPKIDVLPEPVELLPIKRPNTEDFLTFLCFRGTPILPPDLNFFNTASIVDTNGQVHEIKSESSPKNGPIDIGKCGTSSEKPFIAFGVRKRADPIVISRQMDRKRRHALAIQALRRKYQEQKMAKIRALTISKLSEKVTNKTLVRTNTVSKTETVTKKSNTLHKTRVVATKHVKVTTQTLKTTLRPKIKPKMCLRSFRGRFVQKELPFRKKVAAREKVLIRKPLVRQVDTKKTLEKPESSEDEEPTAEPPEEMKSVPVFKSNRKYQSEADPKTSPRVTRSGISDKNKEIRRKQIKKRILMTNPNTIMKPRSLRLTTLKKTVLSQRKCKSVKVKQRLRASQKQKALGKQGASFDKKEKEAPVDNKVGTTEVKSSENVRRNVRNLEHKDSKQGEKKSPNKGEDVGKSTAIKKDYKKVTGYKKETNKFVDKDKKQMNKSVDIRKEVMKSTDIKRDVNKTVEIKKSTRISNIVQKKEINVAKKIAKSPDVKAEARDKLEETKRGLNVASDKERRQTSKKEKVPEDQDQMKLKETSESVNLKKLESKSPDFLKNPSGESPDKVLRIDYVKPTHLKKSKASYLVEETPKKIDDSDTDIEGEVNQQSSEQKSIGSKKSKIEPEYGEQQDKHNRVLKSKKNITSKSIINKATEPPMTKKKTNTKSVEKIDVKEAIKTGEADPNPKKPSDKFPCSKKQLTAVDSVKFNEKESKKQAGKASASTGSSDTESENELDMKLSKLSKKSKLLQAYVDIHEVKDSQAKPSDHQAKKISTSDVEHEELRKLTSTKNAGDGGKELNKDTVSDKKVSGKSSLTDGDSVGEVGNSGKMRTKKRVGSKPFPKRQTASDYTVDNNLDDFEKKIKSNNELLKANLNVDKEKKTLLVEDIEDNTNKMIQKPNSEEVQCKTTHKVESDMKKSTAICQSIENEDTCSQKEKDTVTDNSTETIDLVELKQTISKQNLKNELMDSLGENDPKKSIRKRDKLKNEVDEITDNSKKVFSRQIINDEDLGTSKGMEDNINETIKAEKSTTFDEVDSEDSLNKVKNKTVETRPKEELIVSGISEYDKIEDTKKTKALANEHRDEAVDFNISKVKDLRKREVNIDERPTNRPAEEIIETADSRDIKSEDELIEFTKKPIAMKLSARTMRKMEVISCDDSKRTSVDKEEDVKKRSTKKTMKKNKSKSVKPEAPEEVADLINITDKMQKLETGSEDDIMNDGHNCENTEKNSLQVLEIIDNTEKELVGTINKTSQKQKEGLKKGFVALSKKETHIAKELPESNNESNEEPAQKRVTVDTCRPKRDQLKKENPTSKKDTERRKVSEKEELVSPKLTQRPTRKSKEAATIYMEILSHKLVNDNKVDDEDNVSIDSFPELPNVKKTEQRENELKAQAQSSKDEHKEKPKAKEIDEKADSNSDENDKCLTDKIKIIDKKVASENEAEIVHKDVSVKTGTDLFPVEEIPDDIKLNELKRKLEVSSASKQEHNPKKASGTKRKSPVKDSSLSAPDSGDNTKSAKLRKSDSPKRARNEGKVGPKRPTRSASQLNKAEQSYDSDESFHIEVRVPRKKKITRSNKVTKIHSSDVCLEKPSASLKASPVAKQKSSSSDSDQSTTSDINLQTLANKAKNKKFSKTKSMKKTDHEFSDSDEEPLSKLTNQSMVGSQKSGPQTEKPKEEIPSKTAPKAKSASVKTSLKPAEVDVGKSEVKPKRECAKIPQNYLPMLSSSDEDEIFHGFDEKNVKASKSISAMLPTCSHAPPLLDLLHKDLGKRFGKEKVNMSNEQIEKWLKDSALAGSSIKKENDEMLKFGELIPTESTLESSEPVDTEKLKLALLEGSKPEDKTSCNAESSSTTPLKGMDVKVGDSAKPQIDRKLIFRKCKKETAPNVNAFSPENESSVYAFGEDNEDVISTPFRRPSRRPSSTATSRSEDESSRQDDSLKAGQFRKPVLKQDLSRSSKDDPEPSTTEPEETSHFYIPQKPSKHGLTKLQNKTLLKTSKSSEKLSDLDDFKYKIPSSPSASSSSSAKLSKKPTQKQKCRPAEYVTPVYVSDFPKKTDPARLVEAPVFHPTDQEFQDPLEYIERIRHKAEQFGICRIVPPGGFKPECKVTDDMRFTAYDQYVHKMLYRWGPNFKELMAIKKYLQTQNISLVHPPWIGGMEIDLPRLYQTVQTLGGLKEVIEKKRWPRVSELMKIPKSAQDRVTKLDDIYCKYLLPYDTLSPAEREKLFDEVETEWAKRESKSLMKLQQKSPNAEAEADSEDFEDNDAEECITKGRNMALNAFYRIARNTMSMHFKNNEPSAQEVEQEYWRHVSMRQNHICVHSGSIDCGNWGYGFATAKNSPFARHSWNLKVLTNNNASVLRSLGPIMGVTVPTLHVGMVFSACCWYRDPHGLPWIEYLHTGGNKIWYGIPNSASEAFQSALRQLVPNYCKNKEHWLNSDTVMVPPNLLVEHGVSLCRTIQVPGQFIVVFPKAFTSSVSTGYVVSESVYFAPTYWLKTARGLFDVLRNSSEPSMFSLDRLLLSITNDTRCSADILRQVLPHVQELCDREMQRRDKLRSLGELTRERLPIPEVNRGKKKKFQHGEEGDYECEICKMSLFVSMVFDTQEGLTYCLDHGIEMIESKKVSSANCKFMFTYDDDELAKVPDKMKTSIESKLQKKVPNKYYGMPTLLGRQ
nr:protein piccolo [Leptinotarsa decemlineata]